MMKYIIGIIVILFSYLNVTGQVKLCDGSFEYVEHANFLTKNGEKTDYDSDSFTCLFVKKIIDTYQTEENGFYLVRNSEIHCPYYLYVKHSNGKVVYLKKYDYKSLLKFVRKHIIKLKLSDLEKCKVLENIILFMCERKM